ncbi:CinA family protein [Actinotalea sp. K2]|uniref:CinA family protein n=1 Tax=Actinotalea sp. K2 TaxID=2939438 RepID=UPI0020175BDB|nr:CinA family protein [Actinotalea sp. K2]MCL3860178.1 CinA family protein [Actinotalea sp. K2]
MNPGARRADATELLSLLVAAGRTIAVAESLTGGDLTASLVQVPGASRALRGGVVAYATDLKEVLLDVPHALLEEHGAVHPEVAVAMAQGVRARLGADYGLATTGVAGPDPQGAHRPGTVYVAVADDLSEEVVSLAPGAGASPSTRDEIRAAACREALALALSRVRARDGGGNRGTGATPGALDQT